VRDRVDEMESVAAFGSWRSGMQDWEALAFGVGDFDAETIVAECEPHFDLAATVDDRVRDEFAGDDFDVGQRRLFPAGQCRGDEPPRLARRDW